MSRRDLIHEAVRSALEKDGWEITHDPLFLPSGGTSFKIHLGAEKIIIANKGKKRIAVEIKTFAKISLVYDFYEAFGQYMFYRDAFKDESIERIMFLAISKSNWKRIEGIPFLLKRLAQYEIKLIVVNIPEKTIIEWKE